MVTTRRSLAGRRKCLVTGGAGAVSPSHAMSIAAAPASSCRTVRQGLGFSSNRDLACPRVLTLGLQAPGASTWSFSCKRLALMRCMPCYSQRCQQDTCQRLTIPGALTSIPLTAGFLGKHLVQQLLDSGRYDVAVFDIRDAGISGVQTVVGDLRDRAQVEAAVSGGVPELLQLVRTGHRHRAPRRLQSKQSDNASLQGANVEGCLSITPAHELAPWNCACMTLECAYLLHCSAIQHAKNVCLQCRV